MKRREEGDGMRHSKKGIALGAALSEDESRRGLTSGVAGRVVYEVKAQ